MPMDLHIKESSMVGNKKAELARWQEHVSLMDQQQHPWEVLGAN